MDCNTSSAPRRPQMSSEALAAEGDVCQPCNWSWPHCCPPDLLPEVFLAQAQPPAFHLRAVPSLGPGSGRKGDLYVIILLPSGWAVLKASMALLLEHVHAPQGAAPPMDTAAAQVSPSQTLSPFPRPPLLQPLGMRTLFPSLTQASFIVPLAGILPGVELMPSWPLDFKTGHAWRWKGPSHVVAPRLCEVGHVLGSKTCQG